LHRYLAYAEERLGVQHALDYEEALAKERYGPDILEHLSDDALVNPPIAIPRGDVIRLKRGCTDWWKGQRKRQHVTVSPPPPQQSSTGKPDNVVNYEIRYPEGLGKARYFGPPMRQGEPAEADSWTFYFNEAVQGWAPVPPGYCAPRFSDEGRPNDYEDPFAEPSY
jgi:hypothetical protein